MSIGVYVDHNVAREIVKGLRLRSVDCLTAMEDSHQIADDEPLFLRATALDRILFTSDDDLIRIAAQWQNAGRSFRAVAYFHQLRMTIGDVISEVELLVKASFDDELSNRAVWLPV